MDASSIFGRENLGSSRRSGLINFPALVAVVFSSPTVKESLFISRTAGLAF